jgi:succinate dehydrogenase/fumarate reductase-like Fe-S protein
MRITIVRGPAVDGKTWEEDFDLPDLVGESVSSVLQYISRRIDGSMAYYLSCRRGMCAACVVRINGKNEKACVVEVRDGMVIEPTTPRLMIKDSVVHLGMPRESEIDAGEAFARTDGGNQANRSV